MKNLKQNVDYVEKNPNPWGEFPAIVDTLTEEKNAETETRTKKGSSACAHVHELRLLAR
jgi:hypothetical protein